MSNAALTYGRKLFSIALVFNCLLTIVYATGLLTGFYFEQWLLYYPYLIDAGFLWITIIVAILNLYPSMKIGRIKTGRFLFHHYVYGFIVLALACAFLFFCTPVSFSKLFTENNTDITLNIGRFFVLGGLALILDDFGDISKVTKTILDFFKAKIHLKSTFMHWVHLLLGVISVYVLFAITIWTIQTPGGGTLANFIFIGSLTITSLTAFCGIIQKMWLKLYHNQPSEQDSDH